MGSKERKMAKRMERLDRAIDDLVLVIETLRAAAIMATAVAGDCGRTGDQKAEDGPVAAQNDAGASRVHGHDSVAYQWLVVH